MVREGCFEVTLHWSAIDVSQFRAKRPQYANACLGWLERDDAAAAAPANIGFSGTSIAMVVDLKDNKNANVLGGTCRDWHLAQGRATTHVRKHASAVKNLYSY